MENTSFEQNVLNKVPPNDPEAEIAVISSMLFDKEAVILAYELLRADDFYRPDYRAVFEAIIELFLVNMPVDLITLKNRLEEKDVFEKIGGREALAAIAGTVSTSVNLRHYAKIISDKSVLRKLITASRNIIGACFEAEQNIDDILEQANKSIFDISNQRTTTEFTHIRDALVTTVDKIEEIYKLGTKITGVATGFTDLDHKTAGLHPSDLILIAARPSMGKTAIALNIAQYAALRQNVTTAIFSLEMSKEQLVNRLLCAEAMVDANRLRTGALESTDWSKIAKAIGPLSEAPIYLDDTPGITIAEIRSKCRRLKLEKGLGLIVIDYLQLMSGAGGRSDSRQQEISEISRSLKAIAREMECPVIALSQLSRACETRSDHHPILSDLRESGAIEQDADLVSFIYRDEYYNPETEKKGIAEIIIAKQRNGETGTVELMYLGNHVKFVNVEHGGY